MPEKLIMELKTDNENNLRYHSAALLHGAIMEMVTPEFAEKMHISGLRPFAQSLRTIQGKIIWKVCALEEEAEQQIIGSLMGENFKEIHLKHNNTALEICSKELTRISDQDLIEQFYFADNSRTIRLQFVTPCSFKQDGKYVFWPDMRLIYQSLMKRFDSFSENNAVWMEEALEDLANYTVITGYNIRSTYFSLEGVRIPSFTGTITIRLNGPQQLVNLAHLLVHYGEYSGTGIKTAMGMGDLIVVNNNKHRLEKDIREGEHDR